MTEIDSRALRHAFGSFMTGVTVVTTLDATGEPLGFTANSFTSVSLDPPLVLVCLANSSSNFKAFSKAQGFAVNILAATQKEVSNTFASKVEDRFATVTWKSGPHGSPVIDDVSTWFDCAMYNKVDAGDHLILVGEVQAFENGKHAGLGFVRGAYVTPAAEANALNSNTNLVVSALIEFEGKILLNQDADGKLGLPEIKVDKDGATHALKRLFEKAGVSAEPGFIYSVYEDVSRDMQHISFLCQADGDSAAQGTFTKLSPKVLAQTAEPAVRTMLERFTKESHLGNFGVYYGNQVSGEVHQLASQGSKE